MMKIFNKISFKIVLILATIFLAQAIHAQNVPAPIWHTDGQKTNAGIGAEVYIDRPKDVMVGDMILVIFTQTKTSTNPTESGFSAPTGFTRIHTEHATASESRPEIVAFYRIADGTEPAVFESVATDYNLVPMWKAFAVRITGQDPADPIAAVSGSNSGASSVNTLAIPSLVTARSNSLLVHATSVRSAISHLSTPVNMAHQWFSNGTGTTDNSSNAPALFGSTQTIIGAGSIGGRTSSWEGSAMATGLMFAINPNPVNVDLKIDFSVSPTPHYFADNVTITITVENLSNTIDASDVRVNFMLPEGLGYVSHETTQGSCIPTSGVWNIGYLQASATATNTVIATIVCDETDFSGSGTVSAVEFDIDETNNTAGFTIIPTDGGLDCPVIANDDRVYGAQGQPAKYDVLKNDKGDYDAQTLTIITQPSNGNLVIHRDEANQITGEISYLPNGNFTGEDSYVYKICNTAGNLCDDGTVFVEVQEDFISPCLEATRSKIFYLPFPENNEQLKKSLFAAGGNSSGFNADPKVKNVVSIKIPYPKTVIVYDHWEDGYENDITVPTQSTTQIWGDGDPSNGVAPGYPDDIIPAGGYIIIDTNFDYDRSRNNIQYDGKDKIFSTNNIFISKVTGSVNRFPYQNVKTDVLDVSRFGKIFRVGFGEDINQPSGVTAFKYVSLFVRAATDSTVVEIDVDGSGNNVKTQVLNEGEVWFYNGIGGGGTSGTGVAGDVNNADDIKSTAVVTANEPVGVDVIFGDIATYGTRNIYLLPSKYNSNEYITPVHTTNTDAPVVAYFTNNSNDPVRINWNTGSGQSGNFNIPANGYNYLSLQHASGYRFKSSNNEPYTAMAAIDADNNGSAYDWAYPMIPVEQLTNYSGLAWAPGSDTPGDGNNWTPIWVTAPEATNIYVKWDGKMGDAGPNVSPCGFPYDEVYPAGALESLRLFNNNTNDQSGAAVFTCGVPIAAVWGQDAGKAPTSGSGSMDVGYVMQPGCLDHLIVGNDDMEVTEPGEPVVVDVLGNDGAFLCTIDKSSLSTEGLLQPEHGTVVVNPDGTITYTPNDDEWTGVDYFEYSLCAYEYPNTCDVSLVTIKIMKCEDIAVEAGENIVKGRVFLQLLPEDGQYNGDEKLIPGVKVDLYADLNHNGEYDNGIDKYLASTITDFTGRYNFSTIGNDYAADDFGTGSTAVYNRNTGTQNWSGDWTRSNNTYVQSVVDAIPDVANNRALRINSSAQYASRGLQFSGATGAAVKFCYRRDLATQSGRSLEVRLNSNLLYTISGDDGNGKDLFYINKVVSVPSEYINANGANTLTFITSNNTTTNDYFYIDNVELTYFPASFVVKISDENETYVPSTLLNEAPYVFYGLGNCAPNQYLAVLANMVAIDDEAYVVTDTPTKIDILENDIGNPDPSTVVITEQPEDGQLVINPDGTVTYIPNPSYNGNDSFKYTVCSIEDPAVCSDEATVTVHVQCEHSPGKNVINGMVFGDIDTDGNFEAGERGVPGIQVELYDASNNLIDTQTTCEVGCYQFQIDCKETVRDEFNTPSYSNNDGTHNWSGNWTETTDTGGATGGNIRIENGKLRVAGNGATSQISVKRTVNLTGATSATLSFSYEKSSFNSSSSDWVDIEVSSDGTNFTQLERFGGTAAGSGTRSYDVSSYISANTTIRFIDSSSSNLSTSEYVLFDDVQIEFNDNSPKNYTVKLKSSLDGYNPTTATSAPIALTGCGDAVCSVNFGLGASDLGLVKLVSNPEPFIGDTITFSIIVTNHGPSNNTGVVAVDELPSGFELLSHSATHGTFDTGTGAWDLANMEVGKSDTLSLEVKVLDTGNYVNTATVSGTLLDPNPGNGSGTSTVSPEPWTDLEVKKWISNTPIGESVPFTYTIELTNHGPSKATDVKVQELLDDGYNITSVVPSKGSWEDPIWSIASLEVAETATMVITAVVPMFSGVSSISNTVIATTDTKEKDESNNMASITTAVEEFKGNFWFGGVDNDWADNDNWTGGYVPVHGEDIEFATTSNWTAAAENDLYLDGDRVIGDLINDSDMDLIVTSGNQLIIEGEVKDNNATAGTIVIKAGIDDQDDVEDSSATGSLVFDNPTANQGVEAKVEFYNQAYECDNCGFYRSQWQYFGIPVNAAAFPYQDPIAEIVNQWVETYNGNKWQPAPYSPDTELKAFKGYEITNTSATARPDHIYEFEGELNVGDANIALSKTGNVNYSGTHILANSFTAALPIDEDGVLYDGDWTETVYLFNTGTRDQWRKTNGATITHDTKAGQYKAVPLRVAGMAGLEEQIPSMHSFLIQVEEAGTLTLKYDQLVKNVLVDDKAWRAPQQKQALPYIVVDIVGEETADRVWLFENSNSTTGFDKGWDAYKMPETDIAQVYVSDIAQQAYQVATVPEMTGTHIGLEPFEESLYTLYISTNDAVEMRDLYLYDKQTGAKYAIADDTTYPIVVDKSNNKRLMVVDADFEPQADVDLRVVNKQIHISNPSYGEDQWAYVYNIAGELITQAFIQKGTTHVIGDRTPLHYGVYMVVFKNDMELSVSHKVVVR